MDLFGIKEHDERHDEVERQLRRLIEQVAQLSIDLSVTRTQLRSLSVAVEGKLDMAEVDPGMVTLNEAIGKARVKLEETQEAAEETWNAVSEELAQALDDMRQEWEQEGG